MSALRFDISARCAHTRARTGRVTTLNGSFDTPAFMTVGTRASVKGLLPELVRRTGAQIILNNTYHLMLRPGADLIERFGGVHRFMNWNGPILTDSGGYQAFSMADLNAVDDDGVTFKSIIDGSMVRMTPERAMEVQNQLGSDIAMAFDDCPPSMDPDAGPTNQARLRQAAKRDAMRKKGYDHAERLRVANERTIRWLERCKRAHARAHEQSLFGIIQGGTDLEQRTWCARRVAAIDLPGYAIGGVAVGEPHEQIVQVTRHTTALMPEDKPRYLMGVGYERDIVAAVRAGVDMFDCVLPTRNGRNANAFTTTGQIKLRNARYAEDRGPLEAGCDCPACKPAAHGWETPGGREFSRGYIRYLFSVGEMLGPILVSLHNLRHFQRLMLDIRRAIREDGWLDFARHWPVAAEGLI
ncbi:MAG: tRNA guanosine(34) transglycosylase Tgt [Leptolyngbya sp. PLA3]|nr:MAG: tRNA guanosine(34) transglycosylase Tgt [Cyanobacteria bacterium CYA]MCE7968097.1 tRNA guanosine(34) transglycosylase Tgt [Leptolyngbya sp. PL-A3]